MIDFPRIADVSCKRIQFRPGDRVLVRSYQPMTVDEKKRLCDVICEWAGCEVQVLVYDGRSMEIAVEQN